MCEGSEGWRLEEERMELMVGQTIAENQYRREGEMGRKNIDEMKQKASMHSNKTYKGKDGELYQGNSLPDLAQRGWHKAEHHFWTIQYYSSVQCSTPHCHI